MHAYTAFSRRGRLFEGGDYVKYCSSESSLRGRRWKGKGKGEFARARGRKLPSSLLPRAWCRALIPFPFPFERLPRRLHWKSCPNYFVLFSKKKIPSKKLNMGFLSVPNFSSLINLPSLNCHRSVLLNLIALQLDKEEIKGREDDEGCWGGAIILSIFVKGRRLFERWQLFEEIRYFRRALIISCSCHLWFSKQRMKGRLGGRRKCNQLAKDGRMNSGRGKWEGGKKISSSPLSFSVFLVQHSHEQILVAWPFTLKQCLYHYFMTEHHIDLQIILWPLIVLCLSCFENGLFLYIFEQKRLRFPIFIIILYITNRAQLFKRRLALTRVSFSFYQKHSME